MANYVKFIRGDLTEENLQKVKERGAVPGEVFIGDTGEIFVLKNEEGFRKFDSKTPKEELGNLDLKIPLIYDLEARIREINGETKDKVKELLKDSRVDKDKSSWDWVFYGDRK